jgi:hypothetical protein
LAKVLCRHAVASEDGNRRSKFVESGKIAGGAAGLPSPVMKVPPTPCWTRRCPCG